MAPPLRPPPRQRRAPAPAPAPTAHLDPLLRLRPGSLERSFWTSWRPAILTADLIFAVAPLLTITSDAGRLAAGTCRLHPLRASLTPLFIVLLRARLGDAACWRLRPLVLAACAYLASAGNRCYVNGLALTGAATARRLAPGPCALAAAAAAAADPSTAAWPQGMAYALMQTVPATGSLVYGLLLPVSFRARLVLQSIELLATLPAALPLAVRVLAPYLSPPSPDAVAAAAAAAAERAGGAASACVHTRMRLLDPAAAALQASRESCFATRALLASRCPALVLAVCYGVAVGFILPLAVVYYAEAAAKESHLRSLALKRVAAAAAASASASADPFSDGRSGDRALPQAALLLASASVRPVPSALRAARLAGVCVVAAAVALLAWRVVDTSVDVAARLWPAWLQGSLGLCPGLLPLPGPPPHAGAL